MTRTPVEPIPHTQYPKFQAVPLLLISLPIFIGALDLTVVSAVLPQVVFDLEIPLQTGLDDAAWIVTGYLLAYSVAMTFMGRLSDIYGRRKVYLLALAIFAIGSYLVAVADTWPVEWGLRGSFLLTRARPDPARVTLNALIIARMVQAFGGGAMVPVGMALVGDLYPTGQRARPLGVIAAVDTAGWVVGHLYGGIIVRYFDWRTIFWLNLPICLVAFVLIFLALRNIPQPRREGKMDWIGVILISAGLALLIVGLGSNIDGQSLNAAKPNFPPYSSTSLGGALGLLLLFVVWQVRAAFPLIPLSLFRQRNFSAASVANFLAGFSLFVAIANVPLFINTILAETLAQGAWDSGWMLSALTVPMALAAIPGGAIAARLGYRWPSVIGLAGAIGGLMWMTTWQVGMTYVQMTPHLVLAGVGFGVLIAPIAAAVVDAAPETHRGTASALVIIFRLVGMTIGVSSLTTYGVYRANVLSGQLLPAEADFAEIVRVGMEVAAHVIGETFWIAAGVSVLAFVPVFVLKDDV